MPTLTMVPAQALERALSLGALVATACLMSTVITLYAVGRLDVKQAVDDGSETWRSVVYYRGSQAQASSSTMRGLRSQVRETLIERGRSQTERRFGDTREEAHSPATSVLEQR